MNQHQLSQILVRANEFKEGDLLVGGTTDELERKEARRELSSLRLAQITRARLIEDSLSEELERSIDSQKADEISSLSVADLKRILLGQGAALWARSYRDGLSSEAIAAVAKTMTNDELSTVARSIFNPLPGAGVAIGSESHFGSRIQPNSPGDDEEEILFSILEGLSYGCGDVILGLNPASDDVETIIRLEELLRSVKERLALPARYSVLSDIVKQSAARARAKVDAGFQSLAGTASALFGMAGVTPAELIDLAQGFEGLYFETGQGSAVTNGAAEGVDMVTLESRAYGLARLIHQKTGAWMIVNDVAGFIGPEVFRNSEQLLRACLEDSAMAKLHGLAMGLDVCSTFHMGIAPVELQQLTERIVVQAAPAYLMAVAGNADPMLGYLTTSFRDHPRLRRRARKQIASAMRDRFKALGVMNESGELAANRPGADSLYAMYMKAGGDSRSMDWLKGEGGKKINGLAERGFDLGYGHGPDYAAPPEIEARMNALYANARGALYASIDNAVIRDAATQRLLVRTKSKDRDDYLARPQSGEMIGEEYASRIASLGVSGRPLLQIVISDGLNANAINENLRSLLPPLRRNLATAGLPANDFEIVIENGRVRAGYHIGALLDADAIIHLIGERPGTGLNTLSAYLTYGRDRAGQPRWSVALDHSNTTAVCGIHERGKRPAAAAEEIARCVKRMIEERRSGVELGLQKT